MNKSKIILIGLCIVLSVSLLMVSVFFASSVTETKQYKTELSNLYLKSMYNFVDDVADIEVGLSKLMATNTSSTQRDILSDIYVATNNASNNISNLPIESIKTNNVSSLINTLGGFIYSLLNRSYDNENISDSDYKQLEQMYIRTKALLYDVNEYIGTTKNKYDILKNIDFKNVENSKFDGGMYTNESSSSKIPSLIYDGPFSDSVINKEIKGLGSTNYTETQAYEIVEKLYPDTKIKYIGDSEGVFATYNYKVVSDNILYVNVTKLGGMVLSIVSYGSDGDSVYSVKDGITIAENFAKTMGINNMYGVWTQNINNVLYVNLAPIVDRVVYYPDLIKVKVDLTTGLVIGWEAKNYAYNHTERSEYKTTTSILDGDKYLNDRLEVVERNYAVIPNKYVGETNVYEYICKWSDYTYYIYLDVETFKEVNVMRVVETNSGSLIE